MPLGNLTSQFFANVYLDELDQFVKHVLKAKRYIRYVDDFVIVARTKSELELMKTAIDSFLRDRLALSLHPEKSRIISYQSGTSFLGLRVFGRHRLLKGSNLRKFRRKLITLKAGASIDFQRYDALYDILEGWSAYAKNANAHLLGKRIRAEIGREFPGNIASKEINSHLKYLHQVYKRPFPKPFARGD